MPAITPAQTKWCFWQWCHLKDQSQRVPSSFQTIPTPRLVQGPTRVRTCVVAVMERTKVGTVEQLRLSRRPWEKAGGVSTELDMLPNPNQTEFPGNRGTGNQSTVTRTFQVCSSFHLNPLLQGRGMLWSLEKPVPPPARTGKRKPPSTWETLHRWGLPEWDESQLGRTEPDGGSVAACEI